MKNRQEARKAQIQLLKEITAWMIANDFDPIEIGWLHESWLEEVDE